MERPQGLLRQGTRRGERCGALRGRRAGFGRVAGAVGAYAGPLDEGKLAVRRGGRCRLQAWAAGGHDASVAGAQAGSAAGVGGRGRAAWGCGVGGMWGRERGMGSWSGHRACCRGRGARRARPGSAGRCGAGRRA